MRDILHWPALTLPFISPEPSFSSYSCPQFTTSFILVLIITYSNINLGLLAPFSLILSLPCQDFDHTESYSRNQILNNIPRLPPPSSIISKLGGNWHVLIPFLFIIFPFNTFWIFKAKLWFSWSNPEQYPQTSSSLLHYIKAQRCLANGGQSNFHDPLISLLLLKSPLKWWKYFFRDKKKLTHISLLIAEWVCCP